MEGKMEREKRKEELKRKLEELLNEYSEESIPLSREEIKGLRESVGGISLIPSYEKSKYRRSWLGSVFGQFSIGEMYGIEPEFFTQKMMKCKNFCHFLTRRIKSWNLNAKKRKRCGKATNLRLRRKS